MCLCVLFVHRTSVIPHIPERSLFSRDDLQLISPSEHVEEGESSGDKRGGGVVVSHTHKLA